MKNHILKKDTMARKGSFVESFNPFIGSYVFWLADKEENSPVEVRGRMLLELVKIAPTEIYPGWTLAGEPFTIAPGNPGFSPDPETDYARFIAAKGIDAPYEEIMAACEKHISRGKFLQSEAPGKYAGWNFIGTDKVYSARGWIENHSIRDYAKLIRIGFGGIKREIEAQAKQTAFLKAASNVCEAGILLGKRYAELARQMGLPEMAEICERVPEHGATCFREAVQALWFGHILTCGEDGINANSLGRLDQILYPYYENDNISREEALDLMEELACKQYLDYDVQAITLGGVDADGNCAVNELSYLILEATENMDVIRDLSVRIDQNTPVKFLKKCAGMILRGGGLPFIFNDEAFIKALTDRGIRLEDARDYAPIGCVELTIPGKANPHAVSGWFNSTKCLELAMFNGKDPGSGKQIGPETGCLADFTSFEKFYAAYQKQVEFFAVGYLPD